MNTAVLQSSVRSRYLVLVSVLALIAASWYYMMFEMTMNMTPVAEWLFNDVLMLFVMWSVMMVGMMLPSSLPILSLVMQLNAKRKVALRPYVATLYFVFGYLIVWTLFSLLITLLQWGLHYLSLLSPMMISANALFSALLLIVIGVYQWSPLKQQCLRLCASPLSILSEHWREGVLGAIRLGMKHGQYCLGCCWLLMTLLFVTGVMDLMWIFVITLIVVAEKWLGSISIISKILGGVLVTVGVYQLSVAV